MGVGLGTQRAVARAQKEIVAVKGGDTGIFKDAVGEIFVGGERRWGRIVLRIPGAAPGAEVNGFGFGSDAKGEARAAVDVFKAQSEFGARIGRINRLVRIGGGLARAKFLQVPHAISGDLAFRLFSKNISNEFFSRGAAITL